MTVTKPTFITKLQPPPGRALSLPTNQNPKPDTNPQISNDALQVRSKVFVDEQHCSVEGEIDADDERSWQWVIYTTTSPTPTSNKPETQTEALSQDKDSDTEKAIPVAVIRLVPAPHAPHETLTHPETSPNLPAFDTTHEPYIKLTRVAVLPAYRGHGLSRELVYTALEWARDHGSEIDDAYARTVMKVGAGTGEAGRWKGLVLVHAQVDVEGLYRRLGFETDEGLGRWDEEGIEHVGMWRRLEVQTRSTS